MKAIESRVRSATGLDAIWRGPDRRGIRRKEARFRLTELEGRMGLDAHEGLTLVLMGLMRGERNVGAHAGVDLEPVEALEILGTASWLMRRLDADFARNRSPVSLQSDHPFRSFRSPAGRGPGRLT